MSTCKCDGTISQTFNEMLFGDDLIANINTDPLSGGFDPRPNACDRAVGELRAQGQDPCNLDSPDDLQVLYQSYISPTVETGQQAPVSNPIQKAFDTAQGTATKTTPVVSQSSPKPAQTNYLLLIGFIAILGFGFFLVFR
jgi:hypothetical protein